MMIVAECGPCDGDLDKALQLAESLGHKRDRFATERISLAMKVQWYDADSLVLPGTQRYDHTSGGPPTQHELFQHQLTYDQWLEVAQYCASISLPFFPSVFSIEHLGWAKEMGIQTIKIASGDITYHDLIAAAARYASHLIVSTGASTEEEVEAALTVIDKARGLSNLAVTLLACHLEYPSSADHANLARVSALFIKQHFANRKTVDVGYSDHTRLVTAMGVALGILGASMWEKHYTLWPGTGGDHDFAVSSYHIEEMVNAVQAGTEMLAPGDLVPSPAELEARVGARRSLVAKQDIPRLTKLTKDMFVALRPGTGIPPSDLARITGNIEGQVAPAQRAMVDIPAGTVVTYQMVGNVGATLTVE